jgi:hypothetical protein
MHRLIITTEQYKTLVLREQEARLNTGKRSLNENSKEVILGMALLIGLKLSGLNRQLAQKALEDPAVITQIKTTLENETKTKDMAKAFEEKGMVNPDNFLAKNADKIMQEFNKIAGSNGVGEQAKLNLIKLDSTISKEYEDKKEESSSDIVTIS